MSKTQPKLAFDEYTNEYCCGLIHIGNLQTEIEDSEWGVGTESDISNRVATMATTISDQKSVIKRLKQLRFTKVYSFKNPNTKNTITVWFKRPTAKR